MKKKKRRKLPKLSAAMIIKNEEDNIERCLKSIIDVVDEVVIVDTGSTDRSMEICRSFGKKVKIWEHPWTDDFSYHRNQSIGYTTGDFVLIIDADEELIVTEKKNPIQAWLAEWPINVKFSKILLKDIQHDRETMIFSPPRIFRKDHARYENIVHNSPRTVGLDNTYCFGAIIHHYGYDLSPEKKQIKHKRTRSLLLKRLEVNPNDYEAMYYMSQNCDWVNDDDGTIKWGEKFIENKKSLGSSFYRSVYVTIAKACLRKKKYDDCYRWIVTGLKESPKNLDLLFILSEFGFTVGKSKVGMVAAERFVQEFDNYEPTEVSKENGFTYSYNLVCLSSCLYHLAAGHAVESSSYLVRLEKVLKDVPEDFRERLIGKMNAVLSRVGFSLNQTEDAPIIDTKEIAKPVNKSNVVLLSSKQKRGDKKRIAILDPLRNKFTSMFTDHFMANGYDVKVFVKDNIASAIHWPDVILSLWANEPLLVLTNQDGTLPPIVTYLRSYEMLTPQFMEGINWSSVSELIFVADHIKSLTNKHWERSVGGVNQTVINNFVNFEDFPFYDNGPGNNMAYIGHLNHKKGLELLWQCLYYAIRKNPDMVLHVAGTFQEVRFAEYSEHLIAEMALAGNVVFHKWVDDIGLFLKDMNYVISTSPWEGCPNNIIEAMACGVRPLVHNWVGAKELFGSQNVFSSIGDFTDMIQDRKANAHDYRACVEDRFNHTKQLAKIDAVIERAITSREVPNAKAN